jgi:hypothetical protein
MLMSLPVVVAYLGFVAPGAALQAPSPRTSTPAAVVTRAPSRESPLLHAVESLRLEPSLARESPSASAKRGETAAQPPLRMQRRVANQKAMTFVLLTLAGCAAGGYIGAAVSPDEGDSPGTQYMLPGMQIGAVAGAVLGWKLVR